MNIFKKAMIEPPQSYMTPSWSVAPVVANTQSFYEEFMGRLTQLATMFCGWGSSWHIDGWSSPSAFQLSCVCPHGQNVTVAMSSYLLMTAPTQGGGIAMADDAFTRLKNVCDSMHAHIPPPGQFLYTITDTEPIGYSSQYVPGGMIKMDDFKNLYAEEYAKQVEYMMAYGQSYIQYASASVGSGSYGYGTPSILSTLLKLCPGLATVRRPCPHKCPEYGKTKLPLSNMIQHVNDHHEWSREKIAEWLDIIALDDPNVDLTIKPIKKEKQRE